MHSNLFQSHLKLLKRCAIHPTALLIWATSLSFIALSKAQAAPLPQDEIAPPTVIVVGFVGGFVRPDDERHPEVQMVERISENNPKVHAIVFRNSSTETAHKQILRWLDKDGDGVVSEEEKHRARIILLGHSWGGSAVIQLATLLNESGVPVRLTIQLDSVNKPRGNDCAVPPNVAQALNFYQTRGLAHGCQALQPLDPSRTQILGNVRFDYTAQPAECSSYPWVDRHILKTHNAMDCDPQVWSLVEAEIQRQIQDLAIVQQKTAPYMPAVSDK